MEIFGPHLYAKDKRKTEIGYFNFRLRTSNAEGVYMYMYDKNLVSMSTRGSDLLLCPCYMRIRMSKFRI